MFDGGDMDTEAFLAALTASDNEPEDEDFPEQKYNPSLEPEVSIREVEGDLGLSSVVNEKLPPPVKTEFLDDDVGDLLADDNEPNDEFLASFEVPGDDDGGYLSAEGREEDKREQRRKKKEERLQRKEERRKKREERQQRREKRLFPYKERDDLDADWNPTGAPPKKKRGRPPSAKKRDKKARAAYAKAQRAAMTAEEKQKAREKWREEAKEKRARAKTKSAENGEEANSGGGGRRKKAGDMEPEELDAAGVKWREERRRSRQSIKQEVNYKEISDGDDDLEYLETEESSKPKKTRAKRTSSTPRSRQGGTGGKKKKVAEMNEEEREAAKTKWREEARRRRALRKEKMTDAERKEMLARQRDQKRAARAAQKLKMTPEELEDHNRKRREYMQRVRNALRTPEQLEKLRELRAKQRQEMTPEEREAYKKRRSERAKARNSMLSAEQRQERAQRATMRRIERRANMTEDERQSQRMTSYLKRMARLSEKTPEEIELAKRKLSERRKILRSQMSEDAKARARRRVNEWKKKKRRENGLPVRPRSAPGSRTRESELEQRRRTNLRRKIALRKLLDSGIPMEQLVTPEQRVSYLVKERIRGAKLRLKRKLQASGMPPEEVQKELENFVKNYKPNKPFREYKPCPKKRKALDPSECAQISQELEANPHPLSKFAGMVAALPNPEEDPENEVKLEVEPPQELPSPPKRKYTRKKKNPEVSQPTIAPPPLPHPTVTAPGPSTGSPYFPGTGHVGPQTSFQQFPVQHATIPDHFAHPPPQPLMPWGPPQPPQTFSLQNVLEAVSYQEAQAAVTSTLNFTAFQPHHDNYADSSYHGSSVDDGHYSAPGSPLGGGYSSGEDQGTSQHIHLQLPPPQPPAIATAVVPVSGGFHPFTINWNYPIPSTCTTQNSVTGVPAAAPTSQPPPPPVAPPSASEPTAAQDATPSLMPPPPIIKMHGSVGQSRPRASTAQDPTCVKCDICQNIYRQSYIKEHQASAHNPNYQNGICLLCNLPMGSLRKFLLHYKRVHLGRPEGYQNWFKSRGVPRGATSQKSGTVRDAICEACGLSYPKNYINRHKQTMHNPNYQNGTCTVCGLKFSQSEKWLSHWRKVHQKQPEHRIPRRPPRTIGVNEICDICGEELSTPHSLIRHRIKRHGVKDRDHSKCPYCPKDGFTDGRSWFAHVRKHPEHKIIKPTKCGRCGVGPFKTENELGEHSRDNHEGAFFPCEFCVQHVTTRIGLLYHYFRCVYVSKEKYYELLKREENKDTMVIDNAKIPCEFCGEKRSIVHISRHYSHVHGLKEDMPFECFQCDKKSKTREFWVFHLVDYHGMEWNEELEKIVARVMIRDRSAMKVKNEHGWKPKPPGPKRRKKRVEVDEDDDDNHSDELSESSEPPPPAPRPKRKYVMVKRKRKQDKDSIVPPQKRPRGRPKAAKKRGPGRPKKSETSENVTPKRRPGRPRKNVVKDEVDYPSEAEQDKAGDMSSSDDDWESSELSSSSSDEEGAHQKEEARTDNDREKSQLGEVEIGESNIDKTGENEEPQVKEEVEMSEEVESD